MEYTTKVTQKGQVTIPKELREVAGIPYGTRVAINIDPKTKVLKIKPASDLSKFKGIIKTPKGMSFKDEETAWENSVVEKYKKKLKKATDATRY